MTVKRVRRYGKVWYNVDGQWYTAAAYENQILRKQPPAGDSLVSFRELHSEALAVHPTQIQEAIDSAKSKGVPTEFDGEGRPIFKSSRHFREYARKYGFRHRGY